MEGLKRDIERSMIVRMRYLVPGFGFKRFDRLAGRIMRGSYWTRIWGTCSKYGCDEMGEVHKPRPEAATLSMPEPRPA